METGSFKGGSWNLNPAQLMWKLSDRARQYGESKALTATQALGRKGEHLAHRYLQRCGFRVVARNYKPGSDAEVDIVARINETLVFVEVKTRTTDRYSAPERAVDPEKERHIRRAARAYITRSGAAQDEVRFDIISIVMGAKPKITHFENAF